MTFEELPHALVDVAGAVVLPVRVALDLRELTGIARAFQDLVSRPHGVERKQLVIVPIQIAMGILRAAHGTNGARSCGSTPARTAIAAKYSDSSTPIESP